MADLGDMRDRPAPPSPIKLFLDQRLIPTLIDAAALLEGQVEMAASRARRAPFSTCLIMFGFGWSLGFLAAWPRRSEPSN